jgi:hypothetical protein
MCIRIHNLSWPHHRQVATFHATPDVQRARLEAAAPTRKTAGQKSDWCREGKCTSLFKSPGAGRLQVVGGGTGLSREIHSDLKTALQHRFGRPYVCESRTRPDSWRYFAGQRSSEYTSRRSLPLPADVHVSGGLGLAQARRIAQELFGNSDDEISSSTYQQISRGIGWRPIMSREDAPERTNGTQGSPSHGAS